MKKTFTLLVVIFAIAFSTQAQNAKFSWGLDGGGIDADYPKDIVSDLNGNIFTACTFSQSLTFNGVSITGSEKPAGATNYSQNLFISKISPTKTNLWNIYSNVGVVSPTAMTTTPTGDLIVTGTIFAINLASTTNANIIDAAGTVTTFSGLYKYSSDAQSFVAKFNSEGLIQWAKEINSGKLKLKGGVATNSITCDASGDIYLTGNFPTCLMLPGSNDSITSTNSGTSTKAAFIAKLNGTTGNMIWKKTSSGGIVSEVLNAITYGDDGYIYAAGAFKNVATPVLLTIGNKSFTPGSGSDLTLLKLDTEGNLSYIQTRTNVTETRVKDIIVKNGIVCLAASIKGDNIGVTFSDGQLITTNSTYNAIVAGFNAADGSDIWHKAVMAPGISETLGLAYSIDNRLYSFGYHSNKNGSNPAADVVFGDGFSLPPLSYVSGYDTFLASYDPINGKTKEIHLVASGSDIEMAFSLCSSGKNLYLLGENKSALSTFEDGSTISTTGGFDFFLANYVVTDPSADIKSNEISKIPCAYADNINQQIIIKSVDNVSSITVSDITGRTLKTWSGNAMMKISTAGFESGIYILRMTTSNAENISQRLFIK